MVKITTYKIINNLKIEVNNKRHLLIECYETNEKTQGLKITTLDSHGDIEKATYINEGDIVLLYNHYIYQKEHNKPIF